MFTQKTAKLIPMEEESNFRSEQEKAHSKLRTAQIHNLINSQRNIGNLDSFLGLKAPLKKYNLIREPFDLEVIDNQINESIYLFNKLDIKNGYQTQNMIHNKIMDSLKIIRKELSKENITIDDLQKLLNDKMKNFVELLINPFKITNSPFIQLEIFWIINNIIYLIAKFNINSNFDFQKIMNCLIQHMINIYKTQINDGVRNTLLEKIMRVFGNILYINNSLLEIILNNQVIPFIIGCLNTSISSFRTTCLWLLNKIFGVFEKNGVTKRYINYFNNKDAISNYKFIMSRLENQRSFDEMGEFFWLLNEIAKYDFDILFQIFFQEKNNNNNELTIKNFCIILENSLSVKMYQPCFRLVSNILVACYSLYGNGIVLNTLIENIYNRQNIMLFIQDTLNSPKNKYDYSLVKDIILLIFNLMSFSPLQTCKNFKKGIVNLILDKNYQTDNILMKLLFFVYYKMLAEKKFIFELEDENVIKVCLGIMAHFKNDESSLIVFIDLLYFYLKFRGCNLEGEIENGMKYFIASKEVGIHQYQEILLKLYNVIQVQIPNFYLVK